MANLEFVENHGLFYEGGKSPLVFLQDCLAQSVEYKRAAGYFSSSVFLAINKSLKTFLDSNGAIKLVCSPRLLPEDIEAIQQGSQARLISEERIVSEVKYLLENPETRSATKILGHLISTGNLEIRIAVRTELERGMFHSKVGIFRDSHGGKVAFIGSTNETWSGWSNYGNAESFIAKSSYRGPESQNDVGDIENYFDELWENNLEGLSITSLPETPSELLIESAKNEKLTDLIQDAKTVVERYKSRGHFSSRNSERPLMDHQSAVLVSWRNNNHVGIVDHATGSGKTITALNAIKDWVSEGRPALVIVPSALLQKQWHEEIKTELSLEPLLVGGHSSNRSTWTQILSDKTRKDRDFGPRVTLAVLNSASSEDFVKRILVSEDLLVVVDEVHTIGQAQSIELMKKIINAGARLGLSATYRRFGDEDGTKRIEDVFDKALEPKFTIRDAIKAGRLVPYEYRFGMVQLLEDERVQYEELSNEIRTLVAREGDKDFSKYSRYLRTLIFRRAGILKGARNKSPFASKILKENFQSGDRWLVYCDDRDQMNDVEASINGNLPILKYFDAMDGDKSETLRAFGDQGGILLAIKCLDEGIDIPSATHALILASSQNPREYVQRRGRVLRSDKSTGKYKAVIWDVIVTDNEEVPVNLTELERMKEFAQDASNTSIFIEIMELISRAILRGETNQLLTEDDLDIVTQGNTVAS